MWTSETYQDLEQAKEALANEKVDAVISYKTMSTRSTTPTQTPPKHL